jgi:hypothetical protein
VLCYAAAAPSQSQEVEKRVYNALPGITVVTQLKDLMKRNKCLSTLKAILQYDIKCFGHNYMKLLYR